MSTQGTPAGDAAVQLRNPLTSLAVVLRMALHALMTVLIGFVVVRQVTMPAETSGWIVALALLLLVSYLAGAFLSRSASEPAAGLGWLALVSLECFALIWLTPDAAFLAFPLFFLHLHLLRARFAIPTIVAATALTIVASGAHHGWSTGVVLGPVLGAAVAVVLGLGYRTLYREAKARQELIDELLATRELLAARSREAGTLAERARLARELHDTVAQGLSSIHLLLHAAERAGVPEPALDSIALARDTAAENLAETRRFIRELTPAALDGQTLPDALGRLADITSREGLAVHLTVSGTAHPAPMTIETTLLRIAQASLANVVQHSSASRAELTLTYLEDWIGLDIVDNGQGFDPAAADKVGSFGLHGLRARIETIGGTLTIESEPGAGSAIAVGIDIDPAGGP